GHTQRRRQALIAAQDVVARFTHHQHQRDEKDDQVFRVKDPHALTPSPFGRGGTQRGRLCGSRRHCGSVTTCSWSIARPFTTCVCPDGHRIVTLPRRCSPSPKCRRRSFWLQNPEPPSTTWRCRPGPISTVTSAPIALRLLRVPTSLS